MADAPEGSSRRELLKKVAYVASVIITLPVMPAAAKSGSEHGGYHSYKKYDWDYKKYDWDYKKKYDWGGLEKLLKTFFSKWDR